MNVTSLIVAASVLASCKGSQKSSAEAGESLVAARAKFQTTITGSAAPGDPPEAPPAELRLVTYEAAPGKLAAYVSPDPGDKQKHPAIIWITGGDTASIGDVWSPRDASNDQTARQYRDAGVVTMYPSQRGGNNNPGQREGFYGEVDDVLAAAKYLRDQPFVDAKQIYLGGHSTGGTLVLLVAAAAPKDLFRAVFSFGPVSDVAGYGSSNRFCPFDMTNKTELELRSPLRWNDTIATPTFVLEGSGRGNIGDLRLMKRKGKNPLVTFLEVPGRDHFSALRPINGLIASRIAGGWTTGPVQLSARDVLRVASGVAP